MDAATNLVGLGRRGGRLAEHGKQRRDALGFEVWDVGEQRGAEDGLWLEACGEATPSECERVCGGACEHSAQEGGDDRSLDHPIRAARLRDVAGGARLKDHTTRAQVGVDEDLVSAGLQVVASRDQLLLLREESRDPELQIALIEGDAPAIALLIESWTMTSWSSIAAYRGVELLQRRGRVSLALALADVLVCRDTAFDLAIRLVCRVSDPIDLEQAVASEAVDRDRPGGSSSGVVGISGLGEGFGGFGEDWRGLDDRDLVGNVPLWIAHDLVVEDARGSRILDHELCAGRVIVGAPRRQQETASDTRQHDCRDAGLGTARLS